MVEHVLAKDEIGVRFSVSAQNKNENAKNGSIEPFFAFLSVFWRRG